METMHDSGFICRYCKYNFDSKEELVQHIGNCAVKKKRRACASSRELRECEVCHKTMQKGSLRLHNAIKHAGLRPVCEHCGKSFGNKLRLQEHRRAKHGYEKFRCTHWAYSAWGTTSVTTAARRPTSARRAARASTPRTRWRSTGSRTHGTGASRHYVVKHMRGVHRLAGPVATVKDSE